MISSCISSVSANETISLLSINLFDNIPATYAINVIATAKRLANFADLYWEDIPKINGIYKFYNVL